jgi:hypothetical protein
MPVATGGSALPSWCLNPMRTSSTAMATDITPKDTSRERWPPRARTELTNHAAPELGQSIGRHRWSVRIGCSAEATCHDAILSVARARQGGV